MDQQKIIDQIKSIFEKNDNLSLAEFVNLSGQAYHEVQIDTIKPYKPLKVEPINKDKGQYAAEIQHRETHGIQDADLTQSYNQNTTYADQGSEF